MIEILKDFEDYLLEDGKRANSTKFDEVYQQNVNKASYLHSVFYPFKYTMKHAKA